MPHWRDILRLTPRLFLWSALAVAVCVLVIPPIWVLIYRFVEPPQTSQMQARAKAGMEISRTVIDLENVSPYLVRAVIAAEDARFCSHDGFDRQAIEQALENNRKGGKIRGASTISQQTAKNLFLWERRSWLRKGLEAYFTVLIEWMWPKHRILEAYLNAAEWGDGRFGVEAAAQELFGVSARNLTPLQAARLAAVLPSPNKWSADKPGPYVRRRTATIMARGDYVGRHGLDFCVIGYAAPAPKGQKPPPRKPKKDVLPPLPPPPEAGPESPPPEEEGTAPILDGGEAGELPAEPLMGEPPAPEEPIPETLEAPEPADPPAEAPIITHPNPD